MAKDASMTHEVNTAKQADLSSEGSTGSEASTPQEDNAVQGADAVKKSNTAQEGDLIQDAIVAKKASKYGCIPRTWLHCVKKIAKAIRGRIVEVYSRTRKSKAQGASANPEVNTAQEASTAQEVGTVKGADVTREAGTTQEADAPQEVDTTQNASAVQEVIIVQEVITVQEASTVPEAITVQEASTAQEASTVKEVDGTREAGTTQEADVDKEANTTQESSTVKDTNVAQEATEALTPYPYNVGQVLVLRGPDGRQFDAKITHTYNVTLSPAMVVQIQEDGKPREVVLKVYDRRFGDDWKTNAYDDEPPVPQTKKEEAIWQEFVSKGLVPAFMKEIEAETAQFGMYIEDEEDETKSEWEKLGRRQGARWQQAQHRFDREVRAYEDMRDLQGKCVPRFISTVTLDMPSARADLDPRFFQVPGILIERIKGFNLTNLVTDLPDAPLLVWQDIIQKAIDVAADINRAGVLDADGQPRNCIVTQLEDGSYQPYRIDFAEACFKSQFNDDIDDEEGWWSQVNSHRDQGQLGWLMVCKVKERKGKKIEVTWRDVLPEGQKNSKAQV